MLGTLSSQARAKYVLFVYVLAKFSFNAKRGQQINLEPSFLCWSCKALMSRKSGPTMLDKLTQQEITDTPTYIRGVAKKCNLSDQTLVLFWSECKPVLNYFSKCPTRTFELICFGGKTRPDVDFAKYKRKKGLGFLLVSFLLGVIEWLLSISKTLSDSSPIWYYTTFM